MNLINGKYNQIFLENRLIHSYISKEYNENIMLFIITDGELFFEYENNIIGKIDKNFRNILVLAIESVNRFDEYTPWYESSVVEWIDKFGGEGDQYLDFLIFRLIPFIENIIKVDIKNDNTFMAGASLGGLISTYGIIKYKDKFGGGVLISSSFWYQGFINYVKDTKEINKELIIYMDVGDKEGKGAINYYKDIVKLTEDIYKTLIKKGLKKENIKFIVQEGMTHDGSLFIDRIYDGIKFIVSRKN